ncbi:unnamed protein product [Parnassius mnemosyne]|uniref:Uncharacterized protein n=1 Tax=Parnassius mnemosyne TaxID=213953 RepID=A0AAV1LKS1_9NEOP
MKTILAIVILLILDITFSQILIDNILIDNVIQTMEKPISILAVLCSSSYKKIQIYKALNKGNSSPIYMQYSDEYFSLPPTYVMDQYTTFLINLSCPNVSYYLEKSKQANYFRSPYRWIIFNNNEIKYENNTNFIPAALSKINIFPDSEVIYIHQAQKGGLEFHLIYKVSYNREWQTELYGVYDVKENFKKLDKVAESAAIRRLNLDGYEIKICYVLTNSDSINHLTDGIDDHIDTITKVNFPTTNQLLDFLNARRKFIFADTWGYRHNNTWNGMTGYLVRGEVEIGGSPMFFTTERVSIVEYISSPTPTRSKFVFQQPKLSYENNLFLLSFRKSVWYSIVALIVLLFWALLIVAIWEWKKYNHEMHAREDDPGVLRANVKDVALLVFGATCQQGSPVELKGSLGRTVMLVLFLTVMFLYTSYAANIVALLQSSSSQIKTLEDLLHSRIKFGVHDTVYNRYYFSTATESVRKAIYDTKIAPPGVEPRFMSIEEGVKKIRQGLFAFHMETGVGYKFVGKYFEEGEKCGLQEIQYLQVIDPWLAVRKNTPFMEMFKIGTKRIHEHGLQNRQNRLLYEHKPRCSGREANFVSVSMVDCYPALLVLSYGTLIATVVLIIEFLYNKWKIMYRQIRII